MTMSQPHTCGENGELSISRSHDDYSCALVCIYIPYRGKFSLVQNLAEMRLVSPEEIFAVFIFAERMCNINHTLPVDGHTPRVNQRNDTERRRQEASLWNNGQVFLLCGRLCFYQSIRTAAVDGKSLKETALLILTLTTLKRLYGFVGILYRVILLYKTPKEGRETVENSYIMY